MPHINLIIRKLNISIIIIFCIFFNLHSQNAIRCGNELLFNESKEKKTEYFDNAARLNHDQDNLILRDKINIPIVFHIVYYLESDNITDKKIFEQIEILNNDFRGNNSDLKNLPSEFRDLIGYWNINFHLAAIDPNGKITTGITRVKTTIKDIGLKDELYNSISGGSDSWDTDKYINIWVAETGEIISGSGSYPGQVSKEKEGIVINPKYFGINNSRYGLGRVLTHEMGHYFGLKHIWGDREGCDIDDNVDDTPLQEHSFTGCPDYPQSDCSISQMFMNFMDYVDDQCMIFFTKGQIERMNFTLFSFREDLIDNYYEKLQINISASNFFPNPTSGETTLKFYSNNVNLLNFRLFNSYGNEILEQEMFLNNELKIDLSVYPSGIYFIQFNKITFKIIKL